MTDITIKIDDDLMPSVKKRADKKFFTVSEINSFIKDVINAGFPQTLWICGEIQGFSRNRSKKHIFFELVEKDSESKDVKAKVGLVIFQGVKAQIFVGQLKKGETGLTQKEQKEILDKFRNNEFNVLVATSIGEQGLDITAVNLVIFYEPVPSAIRQIQRAGRTGRHEEGKIIILMTENTRDIGYHWSAHHKQKRMYSNLADLKKKITLQTTTRQPTLKKYQDRYNIFVDHREKGSKVIKELIDVGANVKLEQLHVADFLLSSRAAVEFKTVSDFVDSIVDGRLLEQIKLLKQNYERPLMIIEGIENIYSQRNAFTFTSIPNCPRRTASSPAVRTLSASTCRFQSVGRFPSTWSSRITTSSAPT